MLSKIKPRLRAEWVVMRVVYFRKLLFKYDKKKFSFRRVESEKICSHQSRDLL